MAKVKETGQAAVAVYPFAFSAVVAGRGRNLDREIRIPLFRDEKIPMFRRKGGWCAEFFNPGSLIVSIVLPAEGFVGIQRLFNFSNMVI